MKDAETALSSFEDAALSSINWSLGIGHQDVKLFEFKGLKVAVSIELKAAGVPGVSRMFYVMCHYRINGVGVKRGPALTMLDLGVSPTSGAGRPRGSTGRPVADAPRPRRY